MGKYFLFIFGLLFNYLYAGNGAQLPNAETIDNKLGLYNKDPNVVSLTASDIKTVTFNQNYAYVVEFYNSYCGFCRRFAPKWKALAEDIVNWKDIVKVAALDCSVDENNDVCREFEVMAYPTIRFIPPHYKEGDKQIGIDIAGHDEDVILNGIVNELEKVKNVKHWPNLTPFLESEKSQLFNNNIDYAFLITEKDNKIITNVAREVLLDLHTVKNIIVRRVMDTVELENSFGVKAPSQVIAVDSDSKLVDVNVSSFNRPTVRDAIKHFLRNQNIELIIETSTVQQEKKNDKTFNGISTEVHDKLIKERVKSNPDTIYQADLEQALKYSLYHEIPHFTKISGDKLLALQKYVSMIKNYFPFGRNGMAFLEDLHNFVNTNDELDGEVLRNKLSELENKHKPVFSSSRWIGCYSDKQGLRKFPCSLWQMFHFLTVQASESEKSTDPLEVLHGMHGYIKNFFGCTDCSNHFQTMATKNKIWTVSSKDNAVLWLWTAHNEVNNRLSGDETEDPDFPKIQFPTTDMCTVCRKSNTNNHNGEIDWDKTEVLLYLKRIYTNISRYGVDDESPLPPSLDTLRAQRLLQNVLSDLDMRMVVFLYVFCIGMMIVAVKLFVKRGYRKKMYVHDLLGKV